MLEGVHQPIPEAQNASAPVYVAPPPPRRYACRNLLAAQPVGTEADRLRERYKEIGEAQNHKFGEGLPGSKPPDFNLKVPPGGAPAAAAPKPAGRPAASNPAVPPPVKKRPAAPDPLQ